MKKLLLFFFLIVLNGQNITAQNSGSAALLQKDPVKLFAGGGISAPKNSLSGNFTDFHLAAYIPVKSFGNWSVGIEGGGNYGFSNTLHCPTAEPYQIMGQSVSPTVTQKESSSPKASVFSVGAGPAVSWNISDKFSLMPSFNIAYSSFKENKCSIMQTSKVNGVDYNWELCDQTTKASSGIGALPKLKVIYQLGRIGFWIEGNYLMAQKQEITTRTFSPKGNASPNGMYELEQLKTGTYATSAVSQNYSAFGIAGGISIILGTSVKTRKKQDRNFGEKMVGGVQSRAKALTNDSSIGDLNYDEDYSISDAETLAFLNTGQLIIKKGHYIADYTENPFGTLTLNLLKPTEAKSISEKGVKRLSSGGFRCDKDCKEEKDVCFTCKTGSSKALYYYYDLEPVIENGMVTKVQIKNTKITLDGKELSAEAFQMIRQNQISDDKTDEPSSKAVAPTKVKCKCGTSIYGKDEEACKRICRFLKDGTYSNGKAVFTHTELAQIKKDYLDGMMINMNGEEVLNPELFKPVTTTTDRAGQKVSIKKAGKQYVYLGNQDELVKIISIPSARVKECTDCNETDNCENSSHYDCCCNGGYCWCLLCIVRNILTELPENKAVLTEGETATSPTGTPQSLAKPKGTFLKPAGKAVK